MRSNGVGGVLSRGRENFARSERYDAVRLVAGEIRLVKSEQIGQCVRQHEGDAASIVNLDTPHRVVLNDLFPDFGSKRGFGKDSYATFDAQKSLGGFIRREIESASLSRRSGAYVPKLGELLEARKQRRVGAEKPAHSAANFRVEWVAPMQDAKQDSTIDENRHQSWSA